MTEDEFRTGVGPTFEASRRAAEAIANGTAPSFDYIAEAFVTLSPSWHGDKVAKHRFIERMKAAVDAANRLDQVKKTLFYGRDNGLAPAEGMAAVKTLPLMLGDTEADSATNIIHAIIGIFTEAGEMLEALIEAIDLGKPIDKVNAKEETGDLFWYVAILAKECGFTFDEAQRVNIAKLRARFPDRFTEYDANNRNLSAERDILEGPKPGDTITADIDGKRYVGTVNELSDEARERLSK